MTFLPTFNGYIIHRHLSKVMKAVIQLVILMNVICGTPAERYKTPCTSKFVSAATTAGANKRFIHVCVTRHAKSEIVRPKYEGIHIRVWPSEDLNNTTNNNHYEYLKKFILNYMWNRMVPLYWPAEIVKCWRGRLCCC